MPPFHQLRTGIEALIKNGQLRPGERLPTVVETARACGLSQATALRAMRELGREGYLRAKPGGGTFVAEAVALSTEVIVHRAAPTPTMPRYFLEQQIIEGLARGYDDPLRGFMLTYTFKRKVSAAEMLEVARARRADGLVIYRPPPDIWEALRRTSLKLPCVSIQFQVPDSRVDTVKADPSAALRTLMRRRIEAGGRHFAFLSHHFSVYPVPPDQEEVGGAIYRTFLDVACEAGIEPTVCLSDLTNAEDAAVRKAADNRLAAVARTLPQGCTVVVPTANYLDTLGLLELPLDLVTCTECRATAERITGRVSLVYIGIDRTAEAAVPLLKSPARRRTQVQSGVVWVEPEAIEAKAPEPWRGEGRASGVMP